MEQELISCPVNVDRDDRKSARLAEARMRTEPGVEVIGRFGFAREILRSPKVKQDGAGAEQVAADNPEHVPVFYLDGEAHKRRRAAITKFFYTAHDPSPLPRGDGTNDRKAACAATSVWLGAPR